MADVRMVTFETALGRCRVSWNEIGLTRVLLPNQPPLAGPRFEDGVAVPESVRAAILGMIAVLRGENVDLRDIALDTHAIDPFRLSVYRVTREIEPGTTATYGQIARAIGQPDARAVGTALGQNPFPIVVPCHRVIGATGALTGFSAAGGIATKRRLLEIEGAPGFGQQLLFA